MTAEHERFVLLVREHFDVDVYDGIQGLGYQVEFDPDMLDVLRAAGFGDLAKAWDEGHGAGQVNEHEWRPDRKMTNPYRAKDTP